MFEGSNQKVVDAIEDGKIVKVSEEYAKKEGLFILRRTEPDAKKESLQPSKKTLGEEKRLIFDDFRKPLRWRKNKVVDELIDNFHWEISKTRRMRNITRKQLADAVHENENSIKMLENGILPKEDFVLVNKIQEYFKINLRKDKIDYSKSPRESISAREEKKEVSKPSGESMDSEMLGKDIEIIDED